MNVCVDTCLYLFQVVKVAPTRTLLVRKPAAHKYTDFMGWLASCLLYKRLFFFFFFYIHLCLAIDLTGFIGKGQKFNCSILSALSVDIASIGR